MSYFDDPTSRVGWAWLPVDVAVIGAKICPKMDHDQQGLLPPNVEYFVQSHRIREALEEVKGLLAGKTSMAYMGDMLTLAAFSHAIPINNSLLGAYITEREGLIACQDKQPDLLYITEQLE